MTTRTTNNATMGPTSDLIPSPSDLIPSPRLVILLSGKRKSGKDFIAEKLLRHFNSMGNSAPVKTPSSAPRDTSPPAPRSPSVTLDRAIIVRLSAPLKRRFAEEHQLDFQKLLDSSEYKEKYRKGEMGRVFSTQFTIK